MEGYDINPIIGDGGDLIKALSSFDVQVGGSHYKDMVIQPMTFITLNKISFAEGSVIKYLCRHKSKGGAEDLKKAKHLIDMILDMEYGE